MGESEFQLHLDESLSEEQDIKKMTVKEENGNEISKKAVKKIDTDVKAENSDESDELTTKEEHEENKITDDGDKEAVKEESVKDESESSEEEEENEVDSKPTAVDGKRKRKSVERLVFAKSPAQRKLSEENFGEAGESLGEIEFISHMISKTDTEDLKILHRIIYKTPGKSTQIKKNLRKFKGFSFTESDDNYKQFMQRIQKLKSTQLKSILAVLGLMKTGSKDEISSRMAAFLMSPSAAGSTKKKSKSKRSKKNNSAKKKAGAKRTPGRPRKSKPAAADVSQSDSDSEVSDGDEDSEEEEEEEVKKTPAKKAAKTPVKGSAKKAKTPARKTATPKSKTPTASKRARVEDSDSDEEPILKKKKQEAPTNEALKAFLMSFIKTVDLEEVTMKQIYQRVFDEYPEFDLSDRKEFIKTTVKSLIA